MKQEFNSDTIDALLAHMSKEAYTDLVKVFIDETRLQLTKTSYAHFLQTKDEVIRNVHSIKGNAISLGFDGLSEESAIFEKVLKDGEIKSHIFVDYHLKVDIFLSTIIDYFGIDDGRRF